MTLAVDFSRTRTGPAQPLKLSDALLAGIASRAAAADRGEVDLGDDLAALRAAGVLTAPLPAGDGGSDLGLGAEGAGPCLELLRQLGRANLSVARLVEGHINAVKLIALYATPAARAAAFADVRAGELFGVWGADGAVPVTLATGDEIALHGAKRFASGLGLVTRALVTVRTAQGPQLVLAPVGDPARSDAAVWRMSGMRATASGTYDFEGVSPGPHALIGAPGDLMREPSFEGGVWRYAAAHLGGAEALYTLMLESLTRAGRADDPHQQRRIAEAGAACETARLWLESAAMRVESDPADPEGAAAYALLAREATETACLTVIDRVERALGTFAYDAASPVDRIRRDLSLFLRQAAPDAKRARAARALVAGAALPEAL
ncbi:acyl-CoA dehydrogenase family protein [Acuticoccus sp. MNP-M23]|uniref:acyl-CoA dehydrogenase family protein n=1 Tax=Acuticoccus sp. MNP-M23 TaxID=3072793 RepID=UPI0028166A99|nr:acyl-CoA dehydrogenase family protein [Acuticoccus sp. MNP-M23]WMS44794.1 acyl-CoA dehydrogenase family protein [Acuticoccus sp. MNP-M23]